MTKEKFTYGDQIRRTAGGPVRTVSDIIAGAYHFTDGTFALVEDQDCYEVVKKASGYFLVASNLDDAPLDDYLLHGYEDRDLFRDALRKLLARYGGRTGQHIGERNGFLMLHFYDIPGGQPEEAWLPLYLLHPTDMPEYMAAMHEPVDEITREVEEAFGFD